MYLFDISSMNTTLQAFNFLHLIFLSVYSELCMVLHVSSLSSKSRIAFFPSKTQTQRQDFQGRKTGESWNFVMLKSYFCPIFQSSEACY